MDSYNFINLDSEFKSLIHTEKAATRIALSLCFLLHTKEQAKLLFPPFSVSQYESKYEIHTCCTSFSRLLAMRRISSAVT